MRGIPGVYFHSLVGTRNDIPGVHASGIARRINRHKYDLRELQDHVRITGSPQRRIHAAYRHLLATRIAQPAFHPDGLQQSLDLDQRGLITFTRTSPDGNQRILVAANVTPESKSLELRQHSEFRGARDLLSDSDGLASGARLKPYQVAWYATP